MLSGSYELAMRLLRWASPPLARGSSKLAAGLRGRADASETLSAWAQAHRDETVPLIWMHAPSVGEGLQAKAALDCLREVRPAAQLAYTFFSPSADKFASRLSVDVSAYLPWDVRSELRALLDDLSPGLICFTKTEVWPGLTAAATDRGVPAVLCAATLSRGAGRLRPGARRLLRPVFGALDRVLAIAPEDGERFVQLGVSRDRIEVTGDPGVDSAWRRARDVDPAAPHLAPFAKGSRPTAVAGSTWGPDEEVLVPALAELRERIPGLRCIIAPHEPNDAHLEGLERRLRASGLSSVRLAEVEANGDDGGADVVVVDRVGVLAELYATGRVAYVGGGFGRAGLHSVLEPAALGRPVVFGPSYERSRAAADLIGEGGAVAVTGSPDLVDTLERWLRDDERASAIGARALGYIEGHRGAAHRTAQILARYLPAGAVESRG